MQGKAVEVLKRSVLRPKGKLLTIKPNNNKDIYNFIQSENVVSFHLIVL
jgi:hypothetical protein